MNFDAREYYDKEMEKLGFVKAPESAKKMGFWKQESSPFWKDTKRRQEREVLEARAAMTPEEVDACVRYMGYASRCAAYMGHANCRLCGEELGSCDMLTPDKKWVFPEKWEHYIVLHQVRPDEQFIRDALSWSP